jgi:hypothetical protein
VVNPQSKGTDMTTILTAAIMGPAILACCWAATITTRRERAKRADVLARFIVARFP